MLIADYDEDKVNELMQNEGIIRHRAKIQAIITNARAYLNVTQHQSFYEYLCCIIRQYDEVPKDNRPTHLSDIPVHTIASKQLAKQLKKDGFSFVGASTCYAFMQAVGLVNDHLMTCEFRSC